MRKAPAANHFMPRSNPGTVQSSPSIGMPVGAEGDEMSPRSGGFLAILGAGVVEGSSVGLEVRPPGRNSEMTQPPITPRSNRMMNQGSIVATGFPRRRFDPCLRRRRGLGGGILSSSKSESFLDAGFSRCDGRGLAFILSNFPDITLDLDPDDWPGMAARIWTAVWKRSCGSFSKAFANHSSQPG